MSYHLGLLSMLRCFYMRKCSPFMISIAVLSLFTGIKTATSQHNLLLNTPPVLYVSDRNWRIDEKEPVGQIISRIRAEDSENDELVFGLEPHSHPNYANPNDFAKPSNEKLPFWIDSVEGVVYLNESLVGRAGENFFLYITVSDGQLTAKNEIFVNILGKRDKKYGLRSSSISNVVQNISQFLPSFDQLPGVQSIINKLPNRNLFNNLPAGFGASLNNGIYPPYSNIYPTNSQVLSWSTTQADSGERHTDSESEEHQISMNGPAMTMTTPTTTTRRTKLTPISESGVSVTNNHNEKTISSSSEILSSGRPLDNAQSQSGGNVFLVKATIPTIIALCVLVLVGVIIFGFLHRKRLCAISKTLKKKSKEEMAKKSNQSNLSSNLTDGSNNSMVLQHWNGPIANFNRYVPWERDQQQQATPTNTTNGSVFDLETPTANLENEGVRAGCFDMESKGKKDRWEFPRHRLKFFNILGEGAFGQVWRCEATDINGIEGVTTVAVKTIKENACEVDKKDLLSELDVMKLLAPHVNVVRFLGCCTDKDPIFLIIEYVNRGKLQTYLRNSRAERHYGNTHGKSNILTSGDLTSFMYQVAKGMDYLTSRGIIHRDLAARNILITDDHTCKVADFGFARDVITSKVYERKSEGKLPIRWMAIESLYDNLFSVKSDIWSFGVFMWEVVTLGSTPYPGISAADVMKKIREGYRLEKPEHCRRELYNIMYYCWASNPNERPTFAEIVQMLDKLLHTEMDYIELERFPDHNYYNIANLSGEKL